MQRKYLEALREWNKDPYRKPMIVWGARQVGKTYLVKDLFAEQEYKGRYIYVDCRVNYRFVDYCRKHVNDEEILSYLSLSYQREIGKDTLLIFDEAQECPELLILLKYFCQNHREIPILLTGSMIRLRLKRDSNVRGQKDNNAFLFPIGKINELTVYPLTFGEFLYNRNAMLYKKVKEAYKEKKELSEAEHSMAMSVFYDYLLIGGMPEADRIFLETGSYQKARKTVIELYNNYLEDMPLYQASNESKLRSETIFKTIYSLEQRVQELQARHRPERPSKPGFGVPVGLAEPCPSCLQIHHGQGKSLSPSYGSERGALPSLPFRQRNILLRKPG